MAVLIKQTYEDLKREFCNFFRFAPHVKKWSICNKNIPKVVGYVLILPINLIIPS
jgi:hypothetical protein